MLPSLRRRLASERGAINYVTTFAFLAIAATGYLAYSYIPHWMTNREVVGAMREAAYQAWRNKDDDALRQMIRSKTDQILTVSDETGEYVVIDEGMIHVERDEDFIYIDLSYEIPMHFPGTGKIRRISFDNSVKTDLKSPLAN